MFLTHSCCLQVYWLILFWNFFYMKTLCFFSLTKLY